MGGLFSSPKVPDIPPPEPPPPVEEPPARAEAMKEASDRIRRARMRSGRRSTILGGTAGSEGSVAHKTLLGE
jgi:hypothetical protein